MRQVSNLGFQNRIFKKKMSDAAIHPLSSKWPLLQPDHTLVLKTLHADILLCLELSAGWIGASSGPEAPPHYAG